MASPNTRVVVAFGDSITDGTASTLMATIVGPTISHGGCMRPTAVASLVNAGIGGNQVLGPAEYTVERPFSGGPAAGQRLERDVIALSGVTSVIWLEGINDFGANASADAVQAGMREIVARLRKSIPGVKVIGATVITALGASGAHGSEAEDQKRKALNQFIRTGGLFDGVADFDRATLDPATGQLRPEFVPDSTTGGAGDRLHPNRRLPWPQPIDIKPL